MALMELHDGHPSVLCCGRYVDQGGGKRKGAFAVYLEPWHSDIFEWLDLRKNHGKEEVRHSVVCIMHTCMPTCPFTTTRFLAIHPFRAALLRCLTSWE